MTGGMGAFDHAFSSCVRTLKRRYPHIRLWLILPYLTAYLNNEKAYLEQAYDAILLPQELQGVHYKAAIRQRNRWMSENSDFVVSYIIRPYGGAYQAIKYAEKCGKTIIRV